MCQPLRFEMVGCDLVPLKPHPVYRPPMKWMGNGELVLDGLLRFKPSSLIAAVRFGDAPGETSAHWRQLEL